MPKYINKSQITGEKGVAAFHHYCVNHFPPILWREETKNDFGIDGEIELTKTNESGKVEVTGEILKVQIKSTETGSYISNITESSFEYNASQEDIEYWKNHKLSVVLIIYLVQEEKLYAKKIDDLDFEKSKKRLPIFFDRQKNVLQKGANDFLSRFSDYFNDRVNFDVKELLFTNIFCFNKLPKFIYEYESNVSSVKDIYDSKMKDFPDFILHSSKIYSFIRLESFPDFHKTFTKKTEPKTIYFKTFIKEKETHNYSIELINKYFRDYCYKKGLAYNKDYNRFYFKKLNESPEKTIRKTSYVKEVYRTNNYIPKSNSKEILRETVTRYNYYEKVDFYRHFAFEVNYFNDDNDLFIAITPKYFFTSNGKDVLEDKKKITKYTNYKTTREFNQQVLNHIYFIFQFLSNNKTSVTLAENENCQLSISKMLTFTVPFGIGEETVNNNETESIQPKPIQGSLF